jgi:4-amino-4-deoxy-L-arabinose transferase-like glycosyltransferase
MLAVPKRNFANARFLIGTALFLCALTFYYFAVLNIDYYKTGLLDLGWSDPSQYFAQAKGMMKDGYPYLNFGYQKLPSMYPPGYPALMLPWLKVLPEADSILAPFRTNQTIGLLLLLATFGFYGYLKMPLAGGFAALLLATLPVFFTFCRSSLSEISASAFIALAFMFAYLGLKEERRWKIYLSAIFLGLSLNVRVQSLFFAPLLLAMALFPSRATRLRWFLHCFAVMAVFTLAASPTLVLNTVQFHSPFKTGYDFWLAGGDWPVRSAIFTPGHIPKNAVLLWRELTLRPKLFSAVRYFGTGTSFVAPVILLVCVGVFFIRLNRFVICAFVAGLSFFVLTSSMIPDWVDVRYYLPLLIVLVAVAVLPVIWAAENLFVARRAVASLAIFVLFAAACLGYPSRSLSNTPQIVASGPQTEGNRFQAWDALHFPTPPLPSPWLMAQRHFLEMSGRQPGIVLADINPLFLNALLPDPFVAAHLDGERYVKFRHVVTYDRAQALALVKHGLGQARPVYALFLSQKEMDEKAKRLPQIDGYEWVVGETLPAKAVILKLSPK